MGKIIRLMEIDLGVREYNGFELPVYAAFPGMSGGSDGILMFSEFGNGMSVFG